MALSDAMYAFTNFVVAGDQGRTPMSRFELELLEPRTLLSGIDAGPGTNDRLSTADNLGSLNAGSAIAGAGEIGSDAMGAINRNGDDIDIARFELDRETVVSVEGDFCFSCFPADLVLRLFDADGREVLYNTKNWKWVDSRVSATLLPGTYYLGVSTSNNRFYDPRNGQAIFLGLSGDYDVVIAAQSVPEPTDVAEYISAYFGTGFVGDSAARALENAVPDAVYTTADWGAENYWFQDAVGDVWSLWHGGAVHLRESGTHDWYLTNVTDAAGHSGTVDFEPGSLSAVVTGWRAFGIQIVIEGDVWSLWWSPAASAETYIDLDGELRQGLALGLRGNGWQLSSISAAMVNASDQSPASLGAIRGYTQSQPNGRTSFEPDSTIAANDGIGVLFVVESGDVYVATFSVWQRDIPGADDALNGFWVVEPLASLPTVLDYSAEELGFWLNEFDLRSM